jgi:TPR repeat protein
MLAFCTLYGLGEGTRRGKAPLSDPTVTPAPDRVARAAALLREAADLGHTGSLVMLGDLYAYRLLTSETAPAVETAQLHYLEAVHAEAALTDSEAASRQNLLRDRTDHTVEALMSLAEQAMDAVSGKGDPTPSAIPLPNVWHAYSACAARSSTDALVAMAECLYNGYGTSVNRRAAVRLLERALSLDGGRIAAALWLGDSLRGAWGEKFEPLEADEIYLRGLECPCMESEDRPYALGLRRVDRMRADVRARAEILYRLATLRAVHFSSATHTKESFLYLAEAILMGHAAARDDLARIFAHENKREKGPVRRANREQHKKASRFSRKARLRLRMRETLAALNRHNRAHRQHQEWLCNYYTALCLEPTPFAYPMRSAAVPSDLPDYVTEPVTDVMRANALQYLGECFFEGYGLPVDAAAAVACYRAVLDAAPKGLRNPPLSVTEATYSLGWCLLHGVGTAVDLPEAIRLLNSVSGSHPGACYTLGLCHEEGLGVVAADLREAVKLYRKAHRLGYPGAAAKVDELEKQLRS